MSDNYYEDKSPEEFYNYTTFAEKRDYHKGILTGIPKITKRIYREEFKTSPERGQVEKWDYYTNNEEMIIEKSKKIFKQEIRNVNDPELRQKMINKHVDVIMDCFKPAYLSDTCSF